MIEKFLIFAGFTRQKIEKNENQMIGKNHPDRLPDQWYQNHPGTG